MKQEKCEVTGKAIFLTASDARAAINGFSVRCWDPVTHKRRNRRIKKVNQKRVYYCEDCQGHHLTSQEHYFSEFQINKRRCNSKNTEL